ncbi:MAG: hypothetical protein H0Z35_12450 [Thermoanaerobacteraceae bacterium]|nr:hypothetical protein [Thermoanaerobacteraceae bacterium]
MYLEQFIGQNVYIELNDEARQDRTMKLFYNTHRHDGGYIMNKLLAVDEIGVWIEGFQEVTILADDEGNLLPKEQQRKEEVVASVLIPWNYIRGIFVLNDPAVSNKKIGFNL